MPISAAATPYLQATSSPIVFVPLLTLTLPGLPALRVANNTTDVVSRGQTFQACAFELVLPNQDADKMPSVSLKIVNADRRIVEYIRSLALAPQMLLEVVTNLDFDLVEISISHLKLQQVQYDALEVSGTLEIDNWLNRKFGSAYDPVQFPALFAI